MHGTILLISSLLLPTQTVTMSSKKLDHVITLPECQKSKFVNWPQKTQICTKNADLRAKHCFQKRKFAKQEVSNTQNFEAKSVKKDKFARQKCPKDNFCCKTLYYKTWRFVCGNIQLQKWRLDYYIQYFKK